MSQETYTQTAPNSTQIRTQNNNFYSYNSFKPLKDFKGTIKAYKSFVIEKEKQLIAFIIFLSVGSFLATLFPDSKDYKILSLFISFCSLSLLIFLILVISLFFSKLEIEIDENYLSIDKNNNLEYKNIRSFLMEKNLFSYSFFIYEIDKIEPIFKFKVSSIHEALAIEELLKSKLSKTPHFV